MANISIRRRLCKQSFLKNNVALEMQITEYIMNKLPYAIRRYIFNLAISPCNFSISAFKSAISFWTWTNDWWDKNAWDKPQPIVIALSNTWLTCSMSIVGVNTIKRNTESASLPRQRGVSEPSVGTSEGPCCGRVGVEATLGGGTATPVAGMPARGGELDTGILSGYSEAVRTRGILFEWGDEVVVCDWACGIYGKCSNDMCCSLV